MDKSNFLIYGCYGYTGALISKIAAEQGLRPILAGRNADRVKEQAEKLGLDYRIFSLDNQTTVEEQIKDVQVVIHCAGPFSHTAKIMMKACMAVQTHYTDITGEIEVFELGQHYNKKAKEAGIMVMPGTGFDVVPSDCLAMHLKNRMPDATNLVLAFSGEGGRSSHGTANTAAENLGRGGAIRKNGKITKVPSSYEAREIDFICGKRWASVIPWGDVSTAWFSTQIPNIKVFMSMPQKLIKKLKWADRLGWLLRTGPVQKFIKGRIQKMPAGPSEKQRSTATSHFYGEVTNAKGEKMTTRMVSKEGYTLTALAALNIAQKIMDGNLKVGYQTPASAYGADLIMEIEGTKREDN
ncbi:MAG: hypothetical protein GY810_32130 [Aureispira sp.]|nr:hypothetical protein [Aureispira sp.]